MIFGGVLARVLLMPANHELSDDAARYHWDGKVLVHGINPYLSAPDDPRLQHLRTDEIDLRINHPSVTTCYPPLAQGLFALSYVLSPGRLAGLHWLALFAELLTWLLLARELDRRKLPRANLMLLVWCPLILIESYLPGHTDVLGLPLLLLFFLQVERHRPLRAGVLLALACLIKPLALVLLPAALRELGPRRSVRFCGGLLAVVGAGYLPFLGAGTGLFRSTLLMATDWSFNGSLGALFEKLMPMEAAHLLSAVALAALVLLGTWKGADLLSRMLLAQTAWVICTPILFPWYLIWVMPLLVLRPDPALIGLTTLAPLAEEVVARFHGEGIWTPALWPWLAEYGVFYGLLILGIWRGWGMFRGWRMLTEWGTRQHPRQ